MEFVQTTLLLATVFAVVNFLKFVRAGDWNAAGTQLVVWAGGFAVIALAAQTALFGNYAVNGHALATLGVWDLLFVGLNIGSGGSLANEVKKAIDRHDTAQTPKLFSRS